jgi:hypothetical protein
MPNGHPDHLEKVRRRSRFWAVIWQIGDASYYLGLLGSIILPLVIVGIAIRRFDSCPGLLRGLGLALAFFLGCFPIGLVACGVLKWWSERCAGAE